MFLAMLPHGHCLMKMAVAWSDGCASSLLPWADPGGSGNSVGRMKAGIPLYPMHQSSVNQNFATTVALHQPDVRPSGLVRGSARPPALAFGSPVKTKQFSLERLVS